MRQLLFSIKKARKATDSIDNAEYDLAQRLHADPYFDGDAITVLLHQALHTLPDRQKVVFNMRYFDEMSYKRDFRSIEHFRWRLKGFLPPCGKKNRILCEKTQILKNEYKKRNTGRIAGVSPWF